MMYSLLSPVPVLVRELELLPLLVELVLLLLWGLLLLLQLLGLAVGDPLGALQVRLGETRGESGTSLGLSGYGGLRGSGWETAPSGDCAVRSLATGCLGASAFPEWSATLRSTAPR